MTRPRHGAMVPATARSIVVLPAPLAPTTAVRLTARGRQRNAPQHLHFAVAGFEPLDIEERVGHVLRAPVQRGGKLGIAQISLDHLRMCGDLGRRDLRQASTPKFNTTMRSDRLMIACIRCSIIRIVTPRSRIWRMTPIMCSTSVGLRPASTSSSNSSVGRADERARQFEPLLAGDGEMQRQHRRPIRQADDRDRLARRLAGAIERQIFAAETGAHGAIVQTRHVGRAAARSDACGRGRSARPDTAFFRSVDAIEHDAARFGREHAVDQS